ncbi:SPL family radical SAM protein [Sphingobacterium suaedae]|uniref:Radical SAM protein n=1 Tax=Sphingobacterium suaedae TaxID=1686402 RepID=A0ABW5KEI9_9SPHI
MQHFTVKSVLNKTKQRDPWFLDDYTLNPYSGCSFNCLYCYIRGSKYGINMAEKVQAKSHAIALLDKQLTLRARKKQYGIIVLSSATDPYSYPEETQLLTRSLLEVILKHRFPVHMISKSNLICRDFDLLQRIDEVSILPDDLRDRVSHRAFVTFSFATTDDALAHIFEPGAPTPSVRLEALRSASEKGLHTGVSLMPLLPYITDTAEHLEHMFDTFKQAGAQYIFPATLHVQGTQASDNKTLVLRAIDKHFPHLRATYDRLFQHNHQLPFYYRDAFRQKTEALSRSYGLQNTLFTVEQQDAAC